MRFPAPPARARVLTLAGALAVAALAAPASPARAQSLTIPEYRELILATEGKIERMPGDGLGECIPCVGVATELHEGLAFEPRPPRFRRLGFHASLRLGDCFFVLPADEQLAGRFEIRRQSG